MAVFRGYRRLLVARNRKKRKFSHLFSFNLWSGWWSCRLNSPLLLSQQLRWLLFVFAEQRDHFQLPAGIQCCVSWSRNRERFGAAPRQNYDFTDGSVGAGSRAKTQANDRAIPDMRQPGSNSKTRCCMCVATNPQHYLHPTKRIPKLCQMN